MKRVAIVGAGLAGLVLARELAGLAEIRVFEKSRGYGGRMATRRAGPWQFDHGAQFFIAKSDEFRRFLAPFVEQGLVARWNADFVEIERGAIVSARNWADGPAHYVCVPGMNALARHLAGAVEVELETRVESIEADGGGWALYADRRRSPGRFDWVVTAVPAAQAQALMPDAFAARDAVAGRSMYGCDALMLGFGEALPLAWQAAFVGGADISWISSDSSKPGRPRAFSLLVHSTNRWAEGHSEAPAEAVIAHLLAETSRTIGLDAARAEHVGLHRWRYANSARQAPGDGFFIDPGRGLGAIGDWCIQGRVEAAYRSACGLARRLKSLL